MKKNERLQQGYAGYHEVKIPDALLGITFAMLVMYPTGTPEQADQLGPYPLELARDAEAISHGTDGSPLMYRTLARYLARNGFIVGMPEHPFNNRNNNSLEGTIQNLIYRPRHIRMIIDCFFENKMFEGKVKPNAVSIIGHSLDGYTVLAAAGGLPTSFPHETPDGQPQLIEVASNPRIQSNHPTGICSDFPSLIHNQKIIFLFYLGSYFFQFPKIYLLISFLYLYYLSFLH